jgi:hypothetical protein
MLGRSVDRFQIEAEIDQVRSLGLDALRKRWTTIFGAGPPPGLTKDITARMIAYRLQEEAYGGHDREVARLLDGVARWEKGTVELSRRLKPGTVLVREYGGERYTVTLVPNGYVWQGRTYSSLSIIARAITGTTWSGPRFFGVRNNNGSEAGDQSKAAGANRPTALAMLKVQSPAAIPSSRNRVRR